MASAQVYMCRSQRRGLVSQLRCLLVDYEEETYDAVEATPAQRQEFQRRNTAGRTSASSCAYI